MVSHWGFNLHFSDYYELIIFSCINVYLSFFLCKFFNNYVPIFPLVCLPSSYWLIRCLYRLEIKSFVSHVLSGFFFSLCRIFWSTGCLNFDIDELIKLCLMVSIFCVLCSKLFSTQRLQRYSLPFSSEVFGFLYFSWKS